MQNLQQHLNIEFARAMSARHVTLGSRTRCFPEGDPAAIVSSLPQVHFDRGTGSFRGRRRALTVANDSGTVRLLARTRPAPTAPPGGWGFLDSAEDSAGQPIPICCGDWKDRTIHLLVDLESANAFETGSFPATENDPKEIDEKTRAARVLGESLFARPTDALLRGEEPPWVGPAVAGHLRELLAFRPEMRRGVLRSELSLLLGLARGQRLPAALTRRVESLKQALAAVPAEPVKIDDASVDKEVERLCQLVRSRACAALSFGDREIRGMLNPRRIGQRHWIKPLAFELRLGRRPDPILHFWNPLRPEPSEEEKFARCLEGGEWIWSRISRSGDIYGLIDAVLNFVETNHVRVARFGARGRRRSRPLLSALLDWL